MHAYRITNLLDGKSYIGISCNVVERWHQHRRSAEKGPTCILHKAIRNEGLANFRFEVIASALSWNDLLQLEVQLIEQHESYWMWGRGYNMTYGGVGARGHYKTREQREKHRIAMTGQKRTPEQKARMSAAKIGKTYTDEARANMSAAKLGKPSGGLGRKASAIARDRQRAARLGKKLSPEAVAKLRAIKLTDARRAQISADLTGRPVSLETRQKVSASNKGDYAGLDWRVRRGLGVILGAAALLCVICVQWPRGEALAREGVLPAEMVYPLGSKDVDIADLPKNPDIELTFENKVQFLPGHIEEFAEEVLRCKVIRPGSWSYDNLLRQPYARDSHVSDWRFDAHFRGDEDGSDDCWGLPVIMHSEGYAWLRKMKGLVGPALIRDADEVLDIGGEVHVDNRKNERALKHLQHPKLTIGDFRLTVGHRDLLTSGPCKNYGEDRDHHCRNGLDSPAVSVQEDSGAEDHDLGFEVGRTFFLLLSAVIILLIGDALGERARKHHGIDYQERRNAKR